MRTIAATTRRNAFFRGDMRRRGAVIIANAGFAGVEHSMMRWLLAIAICAPVVAAAQTVRSEEHSFRVVKVVEGLDHPWCVAFLPDGRMLITEREGRLRMVRDGKLDPKPVAGVPEVVQRGQSGLFDVALHPKFAQNRIVYLAY